MIPNFVVRVKVKIKYRTYIAISLLKNQGAEQRLRVGRGSQSAWESVGSQNFWDAGAPPLVWVRV